MRTAAPPPAPAPPPPPPSQTLRWRSFLSSLLKLLMFLQTLAAVSILIYALWLFGRWRSRGLPLDLQGLPAPWFVCALVGVGVLVFLVAFTGHIAADALGTCFLCLYAVLISILIVLEAALTGELVLNKQLEKDLPYDSTGELKKFRAFVKNNMSICKWIIASFIGFQALSLVVAVVLMIPSRRVDYDSDEDFVVIRRPLLRSQGVPAYAATSTDTERFHNIMSSRMRQKNELDPEVAYTQHSIQTGQAHQNP